MYHIGLATHALCESLKQQIKTSHSKEIIQKIKMCSSVAPICGF